MKFIPLKYVDVFFDEKREFMEYTWKTSTEKMSEQEYKQMVNEISQMVMYYEPKYILGNASNQNFLLTWDLSKWLKQILENFQKIVEKYALVLGENFSVRLAYEQILDNTVVNTRFFTAREEALRWLFEDETS